VPVQSKQGKSPGAHPSLNPHRAVPARNQAELLHLAISGSRTWRAIRIPESAFAKYLALRDWRGTNYG